MTPREFYEMLWSSSSELNEFMKSKGLKDVKLTKSLFDISKRQRTLAVFPTASSGSTYSQSGEEAGLRTTFQMYCNTNATEEGVGEALNYYSAVIEWLEQAEFGKYSEITDSVLCRMDEGESVNGFILLLASKIKDETDAGWF